MNSTPPAYRFLIKFPSRERPERFFKTLDAYYQLYSGKHEMQFLITLDEDDASMNNQEVQDRLCAYSNLTYIYGTSRNKIHAVNRDMESRTMFDILLLASDDMVPEVKDYDQIIASKFKTHFPDLDGVTWFNDGYQKDNVNTLCILGRKYYERFHYIYHPEYCSLYSDNEFTEVARQLNKQVYFDEVIIRHHHPLWSAQVQKDELYVKNDMLLGIDAEVYQSRKLRNFDLPSTSTSNEISDSNEGSGKATTLDLADANLINKIFWG